MSGFGSTDSVNTNHGSTGAEGGQKARNEQYFAQLGNANESRSE
jgi:hypothetical protein